VCSSDLGSTGQCQDPGKVFKGKKMAGHMGAKRITTQNLDVVRVDAERGIIMIRGAVPGSKGGWVEVRDAIKGAKVDDLPTPAELRGAAKETPAETPAPDAADSGATDSGATEDGGEA